MTAPVAVGVLGAGALGHVDADGSITPGGVGWRLSPWFGADDRWRVPGDGSASRQVLVDAAPVVRSTTRVPGGDAQAVVYGTGPPPGVGVIEIANESPVPFALALVVQGPSPGTRHDALIDGTDAIVDGSVVLRGARPWSGCVAGASPRDLLAQLTAGRADVALPRPGTPVSGVAVALLAPVAHRAALRIAMTQLTTDPGSGDPRGLPGTEETVRSWQMHRTRGVQVELPDARLQDALHAARSAALLEGRAAAALEDWGFDAESEIAWRAMSWGSRRQAARRASTPARWADVQALLDAASPVWTWDGGPDPFLLALRSLLVHEAAARTATRREHEVTLCAELPPAWVGQPVDVRGAPTRHGRVSYALRWHGSRAALLWECERPGMTLRAPGLDPAWSTTEPRGETLLPPHPAAIG